MDMIWIPICFAICLTVIALALISGKQDADARRHEREMLDAGYRQEPVQLVNGDGDVHEHLRWVHQTDVSNDDQTPQTG